ncbi:hypothetical protein XELAEV_18032704mg [Xenopus laevis]|uniref:Septin-type G domain-containing protein n=1 Tax=Xenopus laevis TaxID=8355 RepID=A0A974CJE0_XENLA|nr:hypothetical protein XELAEV_18032704mg [Xenopus laevis]
MPPFTSSLFEQKEPAAKSDPTKYELKLLRLHSEGKYKRQQFGIENPHKANKVMMMVGETGSGKTTLINTLINFILGVKWEDKYRYRLINENKSINAALSRTSEITIYQINHMEGFTIPHSLTIIDTPGFGSTEGREQDRHKAQQFQEFFNSLDRINAICFVVKSSCNRLTSTQRYVFDSILSMFGKDIEQNIVICATYADICKPTVVEALNEVQFPCAKRDGIPVYFKFNSCVLYTKSSEEEGDEDISQTIFKQLKQNSHRMFDTLKVLDPNTLYLTKEVLSERNVLEITMEGLLPKIKEIALKQHELAKTEQIVKQHQEDCKNDIDFEYEVKETIKEKKRFDPVAALCEVFTWGRNCTVCEHNAGSHYRENHVWENVVVTNKKTYKELKERYEKAFNDKLTTEEHLKKEMECEEDSVMELIGRAAQWLQRLHAIALKPDPPTVSDYIDLLIRIEEQETQPGYKERIDTLMKVKGKAENLHLLQFKARRPEAIEAHRVPQ